MSAEDAEKLNKKDGITSYKEGSLTQRFSSGQEIIDWAIGIYQEFVPGAILLIRGRPANADPQPVLDGPGELMEKMNALAARSEEIGCWDGGHRAEMQKICDEWDAIWKTLVR